MARPSRGRRARRLRWTVATLIVVGVLGSTGATYLYLSTRPEPYRPGENDAEITSVLAKDLPQDAPRPLLRDVTREAGLSHFVQFAGGRSSQLPEDMGSGAAWGDYDNDGDEDLFLVSSGGNLDLEPGERAASELYENLGDGTFRQFRGFPETRVIGMGAAWGDYDADGWLDLVVTGHDSLLLFHNESGRFQRRQLLPDPRGFWAGAAWSDFDRDGDLDLYVCGYVQYVAGDANRARATLQYGRSVPYTLNPASYRAERNLLFRNESDGTFTEVGESLGVANPKGRSLGALWHDLDDDGWPDLYVANDISDNVLYHNVGGTFEEISHAAFVADYRGAMGLAAADWNRDGDDDLFVSHWIAQENALYDSLLSQLPTGSPLRFMDVADQRGLGQIALRRVGWGSQFVDLDSDGWLDLAVANGSTFETDDSPKRLVPQESFLLWNRRGEHFHDLAPGVEGLATPRVGRGLAVADYDDDGDVDLLVVHHGEGVQLLRNDMQQGNWLEVRLLGPVDGARLILRIGEVPLRRTLSSASYLSQSSRVAHFGLGSATRADSLEVRWPDGQTDSFRDLEAGAMLEIAPGDTRPRRIVPRETATVPRRSPNRPESSRAGIDAQDRERIRDFWAKQRAAMNAVKVDGDLPRAIELFREALALDPAHEDSRYYLANCMAAEGDSSGAITQLEELIRINPESHRGHMRLGMLVARTAESPADLTRATEELERALSINREETGALLALGEIALLQGDLEQAEQRLAWACQTNPRAAGGFYLRAYVAWRRGDAAGSTELLGQARGAFGEEWRPAGTTAEGDVAQKMHQEQTPLSGYWTTWDGREDPTRAFVDLHEHLAGGG